MRSGLRVSGQDKAPGEGNEGGDPPVPQSRHRADPTTPLPRYPERLVGSRHGPAIFGGPLEWSGTDKKPMSGLLGILTMRERRLLFRDAEQHRHDQHRGQQAVRYTDRGHHRGRECQAARFETTSAAPPHHRRPLSGRNAGGQTPYVWRFVRDVAVRALVDSSPPPSSRPLSGEMSLGTALPRRAAARPCGPAIA